MMQTILNKIGRIGGCIALSFVAMLLSQAAYALDCVEKGTNVVNKPGIPIGQLAIPSNIALAQNLGIERYYGNGILRQCFRLGI